MNRTSNAYSVLQAIAAIVGLALIFWSFGLPSVQLARAATITSYSDTLSDSEPSAASNHTLEYVTNDGVQSGEAIEITFESFTGVAALSEEDVDVAVNGTDVDLAASASIGLWGVSAAGDTLTITAASDANVGGFATVTIEIGTNATNNGTGDTQITNPAASGSYEIALDSGNIDTGSTEVAIVEAITVSAAVDTVLTFAVNGVGSGVTVGGDTTDETSTATTTPFGELSAGTAKEVAQELVVNTNSSNGFSVTVQVDQQLTSSALSADIDGFAKGAFTTTPISWVVPSASVGSEETYGHWGLTSDDGSDMPLDFSGATNFVAASTTPVTVFSHTGVANGMTQGQGTTTVLYKAEISALQEAGSDYTATLTYVATPMF